MDRTLQLKTINEFLGTKFKLNEIDKINIFNDIFNKLQLKIDKKKYPNSVFFFYDDTVYMELEIKNRYLYCSYKYIWSIFEKGFDMQYNDIQTFIKVRVEQHFKDGPVGPVIPLPMRVEQ